MEERYVAGSRIKFPCLQNLTWNEKLFKEGLDFVCSLFRVPRIFPDQDPSKVCAQAKPRGARMISRHAMAMSVGNTPMAP